MRLIFSTGSLYNYSVARCFELAARAGFDGIELLVDHRWDTRQGAYLQQLVDTWRLPIVAVHSPFMSVPGWGADPVALLAHASRLAEAVGAGVIVHHLPLRLGYGILQVGERRLVIPLPRGAAERRYETWLRTAYADLQAGAPVRLCIENMPARRRWGRRWNVHAWNNPVAIQRFPSLTMDTTHLGTWGYEPVAIYQQWRGKVGHVHLSNFDGREHRLPEAGQLRLDQLVQALARDGYQGALSWELHPDALEAGAPDERLVEILQRSLQHCRQWATPPARAGVEHGGGSSNPQQV